MTAGGSAERRATDRPGLKVLVVTPIFPWPEIAGARIRVANVVRALAKLGAVDVFAIDGRGREVPPDEPVARLGVASRPTNSYRGLRRIRRIARRRLTLEMRDYSELRSLFEAWARPPYDIAWLARAESYVALGDLVGAPSIVDLDDLQDYKMVGWLRTNGNPESASRGPGRVAPPAGLVRRWGSHLQGAIDLRLWRKLRRRIAASVEAVAVCSSLDADRVAVPNTVVIPNGYAAPSDPAGRIEVGTPPTVAFVGLLSYPPNRDAAYYLVRKVLPRLRVRVPGVQVRLVGRYGEGMEELASAGEVTLTGPVDDVVAELARADIVVVPIRFGSGTRVKILEAFAHRLPVVSTTIGCEGLDAIDGRHLLVADDAETFATACAKVLGDTRLRRRLTEEAHALYWHRYRWDDIGETVAELAARIAAGSGSENVRAYETKKE